MTLVPTATPLLPQASPESLDLSEVRLQTLSDAFSREVKRGTLPGAVLMVGRRGQIGWFDAVGRQSPALNAPMQRDSVFRIFSMTKPIVSMGILMLAEAGRLILNDPLSKFIPAFARTQVGVVRDGMVKLEPVKRAITLHDLLRHTGGIAYEIDGDGPIQTLYAQAKLHRRDQTNEEHAEAVAKLPLISEPGSEWHYSRSIDILGRVIEVVSGQTLSAFLNERFFNPLQMADTGFYASPDCADRLAQPFDTDPWTGAKISTFNPLEKPKFESGGIGLVSTVADYARFTQMLMNGGSLDGVRLIGRKTLDLMRSNHLGPDVKVNSSYIPPGHGFGLGFAVRMHQGLAPFPGSVGQYFWNGSFGTHFFIDPAEELFAIVMTQAPGQRQYLRDMFRNLVYAALD